jgi:hypothetical protein
MDDLSPESRALYEMLRAESREEYESRFVLYKKEMADALKVFVDDSAAQIKSVRASVDTGQQAMRADLASVQANLGHELDAVKSSLFAEIATLSAAVDRALPTPPAPLATHGGDAGLFRHCSSQPTRGTTSATHEFPPVRGNFLDQPIVPLSLPEQVPLSPNSNASHSGPRVDLPQFDGANPKLWQRHCEEYFHRWGTASSLWPSYASSLFIGEAATWLEAYLNQTPDPVWSEFVTAVLTRFGRNQHQILVRRLLHIAQTSIVEDYVRRFS